MEAGSLVPVLGPWHIPYQPAVARGLGVQLAGEQTGAVWCSLSLGSCIFRPVDRISECPPQCVAGHRVQLPFSPEYQV